MASSPRRAVRPSFGSGTPAVYSKSPASRPPGGPRARGGGGGGIGGAPPPGTLTPLQKFEAKRHNEGVKAFASWMNTLSGVVIGAAAIIPGVKGMDAFVHEYQPVWFFIGLCLHGVGQAALRFEMRSEE
jgi:hypothetical protein